MTALKAKEGILIYSPDVLQGQKVQAIIVEILEKEITVFVSITDLVIKKGTILFACFSDHNADYEFQTLCLEDKHKDENIIHISKPITLKKLLHRKHPRLIINVPGFIHDYLQKNPLPCTVIDISLGGALISVKSQHKKNELIKLSFTVPNSESFKFLDAVIVWGSKAGLVLSKYGLQFQNLSEANRIKLMQLINSKMIK